MSNYPCPSLPTSVTQFDLRNPANCLKLCSELLQAYYQVLSGHGRVTVRFQERWTEYQKGNAEQLRQAYQQMYNQCPAAAQNGLPNLGSETATMRGAPARGFRNFDDRL